jgi:hypothetical protein
VPDVSEIVYVRSVNMSRRECALEVNEKALLLTYVVLKQIAHCLFGCETWSHIL